MFMRMLVLVLSFCHEQGQARCTVNAASVRQPLVRVATTARGFCDFHVDFHIMFRSNDLITLLSFPCACRLRQTLQKEKMMLKKTINTQAHVPGLVWRQSRDLSQDHQGQYHCAQERRNLTCRSSISCSAWVFLQFHWREQPQVCGCHPNFGQGALDPLGKLMGGTLLGSYRRNLESELMQN